MAISGDRLFGRRLVVRIFRSRRFIPDFDRAIELDRQRLAATVNGFAGLDADPAFGNRIFLDILAFALLEADTNAALERFARRPLEPMPLCSPRLGTERAAQKCSKVRNL